MANRVGGGLVGMAWAVGYKDREGCEQYQELALVGTTVWSLLLAWRFCFIFPQLSCRALSDSLASRVPTERRAAG